MAISLGGGLRLTQGRDGFQTVEEKAVGEQASNGAGCSWLAPDQSLSGTGSRSWGSSACTPGPWRTLFWAGHPGMLRELGTSLKVFKLRSELRLNTGTDSLQRPWTVGAPFLCLGFPSKSRVNNPTLKLSEAMEECVGHISLGVPPAPPPSNALSQRSAAGRLGEGQGQRGMIGWEKRESQPTLLLWGDSKEEKARASLE